MNRKNGVTLISLVITIVVILILASITIYTGTANIRETKDSVAKTELQLVQQVILEKYAKYNLTNDETLLVGEKITNFDDIDEVIQQIKDKTGITIELKDPNIENYYLLNMDSLATMGITNTEDEYIINYKTGEVINKTKLSTGKSKEPLYLYSKKLTEITPESYGAIVKGYECENSAGVKDWKIFYADENNVYLIAADYIHKDYCPGSANQSIYENDTPYKLSMQNVIKDYNGSEDIKQSKIRNLNKSYFDYLKANGNQQSINGNIKAVAYMLDTEVWSVYKGEKAEYAIGAPTIEMLFNSYNQKYKTNNKYKVRVKDIIGYELSYDSGNSWDLSTGNSSENNLNKR